MPELTTIDDLLDTIPRSELEQVAGVGSFNSSEGRALDEGKINAAIKFAGDMIRGYLQKRYPLVRELTPEDTPDLIKGYAADIVRYRLRLRSGNRNTTTEEVETRYKEARDWLREVARGLVNVDMSDVAGGTDTGASGDVNPSGTVRADSQPTRAADILGGYL